MKYERMKLWLNILLYFYIKLSKGKGICPDIHVTTHVLQTLPPLPVGAQQPATIDPTLDLRTRYPLWLGGLRQSGIRSLPDTSTHSQHWESNPGNWIEPQTFSS